MPIYDHLWGTSVRLGETVDVLEADVAESTEICWEWTKEWS